MALEGTLRDFNLADIFQLIGLQRKSGVLTLKREADVVTVSFVKGAVVTADSLHRPLEDRLGGVLVKTGKLTEARLNEALLHQKKTLQRLGHILLQKKFITEDDLRHALEVQLTQIIFRLFRWEDGDYHFSQEDEVDYDRDLMHPIPADNILMEGARMVDEWPLIERRIPSFDMVFRPVEAGREALESGISSVYDDDIDFGLLDEGEAPRHDGEVGVRLSRDEAQILGLVDGERTVQEVIDCTALGEFETGRILCQLLDRQLLALPKGAGVQQTAAAAPSVVRRIPLVPLLSWSLLGVGLASALLAASQIATFVTGWPGGRLGDHPGHPSGVVSATLGIDKVKLAVSRTRLERLDRALYTGCLVKLAGSAELGTGLEAGELDRLLPAPGANAFEVLTDAAGAAAAGYGAPLLRQSALRDPWGRSLPFRPTEDYQRGWTGGGATPYYELWGREPARGPGREGNQDDRLRIRRELWEFRPGILLSASPD